MNQKGPSKRKQKGKKMKEKLGLKIPRNMKEALPFDRENKNNK